MSRLFLLATTLLFSLPVWAGTAEGVRAFEAGDYEKAYEELMPAGEDGDPEAQYYLGGMYWQGDHVEKDLDAAREWLERASSTGHAGASLELGYLYSNGIGVPVDKHKAATLYRKAAEAGDPIAQRNLGLIYKDGWDGSEEMSLAYVKGEIEPVERDYNEALHWFHEAAQQGDAVAQYELGRLYRYPNNGHERELRKAIYWTYRAAKNGYAKAQAGLSSMLLQGIGAPPSVLAAYEWALYARAQDYPGGQIAWEGRHYFISEAQAKEVERRFQAGGWPEQPAFSEQEIKELKRE